MALPYVLHRDSTIPLVIVAAAAFLAHVLGADVVLPLAAWWAVLVGAAGGVLFAYRHATAVVSSWDRALVTRLETERPDYLKVVRATLYYPVYLWSIVFASTAIALGSDWLGWLALVPPDILLLCMAAWVWLGGWSLASVLQALRLGLKFQEWRDTLERAREEASSGAP